ncbi:MAG: hypothetical protein AAF908_05055, partial [Pseudomonadota bacterium]
GDPVIGRRGSLSWRVGNEIIRADIAIERIGPDVRSEMGGVELFARISGEAVDRLRPGAFVTVTLPGRLYENVALVPEAALYDGDHVFAVVDGRLQRRDVSVLAWYGETVYLAGALDGEEVLVTRLTEAGGGVRVEARLTEVADTSRPVAPD